MHSEIERLKITGKLKMTVDKSIFKAYDIRGVVGKSLTEEVVRDIGRVLGTMGLDRKSTRLNSSH